MDKSLDELRAVIEADQEAAEEAKLNEIEDPELEEDSDETPSQEASEEDPADDNSEQDEWIVPGKARTSEDLVKLYKDAESYIGRQGSEIQKLRNAVQQAPLKGETNEDRDDRLARFADAVKKDPIAAIQDIVRQETGKDQASRQAKEFERVYEQSKQDPEFVELEPTMVAIAQQYGDMIYQNNMQHDPRLLDILRMAAKGHQVNELAKKAKAEGITKGQNLHRRKEKARIEGSSGTKKTSKIDLTKLSAEEMKEKFRKGEIDVTE